jgi:uncharacterized iron-regulated protein
MKVGRHALLLCLLPLGCATAAVKAPAMNLPFGDPARRDREAPLVLDAITATASGELLTPEGLAARLAPVRLVFVGESHTDPNVHAAQRRLIEALSLAGRKVLVGLEMFPYTVQPALDGWWQGKLEEAAFLRESHWYKHWGFDFRLYRDIFVVARERSLPIFGVNTPREVVTAVRKKGFANLTPEEAAHIPVKVDTASDEHRRLFRAFFAEDGGGDAHSGMTDAQWDAMFNAQCTWDATMAKNAVQALEAHADPLAVMVVLIGSGHVAFGLGAQRQAAHFYQGPIATVIPLPILDDDAERTRVRASYADYLWGLPPEPLLPPYPSLGLSVADRKEAHPVVTSVMAGSPAATAGLLAEDRIVSVDGTAVADKEAFLASLGGKRWGDAVKLVVARAGKEVTAEAALRRSFPLK